MQPSTVAQEPSNVFDFVSKLGRFGFDSKFSTLNSDGHSSFQSNYLYFHSFGGGVGEKKRRVVASLSLGSRSASSIRRTWIEFNRVIRFHCGRIPIGFASVQAGFGENNALVEDRRGVLEGEGLPFNGVEAENSKKVLILMSDTGGGHRASAEAIKAAFNEEFGDEYQSVCHRCLLLIYGRIILPGHLTNCPEVIVSWLNMDLFGK